VSGIVFRPDGFRVLIGSPGSIFFLNQNDVVLVKKQKSTGCNRVFDQVLPSQPGHRVNPLGHTVFFLPLFFLQLDPDPAPSPGSTRRAGPSLKTMVLGMKMSISMAPLQGKLC
jgi:hypothetical protein